MAISKVANPGNIGDNVITNDSLNATAVNNIGGATNITVYAVKIDCTSNANENVYFKGYNSEAPVVGTDDPHIILKGYKGEATEYFNGNGIVMTDLSIACVKTPGVAGTANPTGTVNVTIIASET